MEAIPINVYAEEVHKLSFISIAEDTDRLKKSIAFLKLLIDRYAFPMES
jgi:hypothetical protein